MELLAIMMPAVVRYPFKAQKRKDESQKHLSSELLKLINVKAMGK